MLKHINFFALVIGWFHVLMWLLGSFNVLDYRLCIDAPHKCFLKSEAV